MYDPKTPPPPLFDSPKLTWWAFWDALGKFFIVLACAWTIAWVFAPSRSHGVDPTWSGPPVFGYGLLCLILAKLHKPPAQ